MATTLTMPKLGLTMTEGTVVKWLKQHGEAVDKGQPIVVVMSKKITFEVEAPASGVLHIVARPKDVRPVTGVIGYILAPGEPLPSGESVPSGESAPTAEPLPPREPLAAARPPAPGIRSNEAGAPAAAASAREVRSSPAARRLARELGVDLARVPGSGEDGRITESDVQAFCDREATITATPLARRMAEEEGLDLAQIAGTGPDGRITEDDVLRALESSMAPLPTASGGGRSLPFSGMRQGIAEGMMASLHSTAQLTLTARADVTELAELRHVLRARWGLPISYTDLVVKAAALSLREHPVLNSTLTGDRIILYDHVNIGVAVALDDGLIVPVVRGADQLTVPTLHRAIEALAGKARAGALVVDEVTGGTFTVTNLGMYGIDSFTPIINPPEVAILGVGGVAEELALANGRVAARSRMILSLTIDHRVVDGAPGAAFLQTCVQFLEHPALLFAPREA